MTIHGALTHAEGERLAARIAELEHERKHLLAVIEILKEASSSLHFIDILQAIARKLGESFGLDRCSIFLGEKGGRQVRLVASYEDPTIRNYVVDLDRYPELKRAIASIGVLTHFDAIAKGEITQRACEAAFDIGQGVESVTLNLGGDLCVRGATGAPTGIASPLSSSESAEIVALVRLRDCSMATSGASHRGFRIGDRWYSHIIDPRTGRPVDHVVGATVIAQSGADADAFHPMARKRRTEGRPAPADGLRRQRHPQFAGA